MSTLVVYESMWASTRAVAEAAAHGTGLRSDTPILAPAAPTSPGAHLQSVLEHLGHRCPGACRSTAEEIGASVWFARRRIVVDSGRPAALVVLDCSAYTGPLLMQRLLLRRINACTSIDGVQVCERRSGDVGHAVAAVRALRLGTPSTDLVADLTACGS
ncbi:hypothetical protein ACI3EY_06865 [Ornithinimicrobium sp. LYQ92]|uniref:hypothetical protein n=1 Tax=Serinicoccus sp. LYQ92 TaxID=3378798 RepID=UPI003852B572